MEAAKRAPRIAGRTHVAPPVRKRLERLARSATAQRRLVDRARIVLAAAGGASNAEIARSLGFTQKTGRKWPGPFAPRGTPPALHDSQPILPLADAGSGSCLVAAG